MSDFSKGNWQRIESLFHAALERAPSGRASFLDQACGNDADLRREVDSLLAVSDKTVAFLHNRVQQAAHQLRDSELGSAPQLGAYRLVRVLGEGGMGRVYLAERADDLFHQQVAIKLMHAGYAQTQRMLLRFAEERQILANLNHPNIARLFDGGIHDGVPYLVMEYIDGIPIDEYCRNKKLGTEERLQLFCAVCGAVEYAHKNLVVHRDLKPVNILVTAQGVPKLLDFGIAKLMGSDSANQAQTRTAERMMTPEYASPEQVRGDVITTSTDVYALGVLLYELLSGKRPFHLETNSPIEIARAICEQTPTAPSVAARQNPDSAPSDALRKVKSDLDNIVFMAMRKEPSRRYVSASQLMEDVEAHLGGYPVRARTDAWTYRSGKFIQRHKASVIAAVVVAIALVAFSIGMGIFAWRAQRERFAAERETQFLNSIFLSTTPGQARGREVTGPELLEAGARRVETEFSAEPLLQATLLDNIGHAYLDLGLYQKAEPLLQRAYDLRRTNLGESQLDTAISLDRLGTAIRLELDYKRAEPFFRKALAIRQAKLRPGDALITQSLANLGECLYLEEKDSESESLLRESLELARQDHREADISTAEVYLALVLERKGGFQEAAQLLREALTITEKLEGADSPDYANGLHNLAGTLIDAGDLSGAEAMDRQSLAIRRKILGPDNPEICFPLNNLGFIFLEKGDWASAEPFLKENLELRRKLSGQHPLFAGALNNWARMLQEKGDYRQAEDYYRQAAAMMKEASGPQSWGLAKILANLGLLRADEGKYSEAQELEQAAMEMRQQLGGAEGPDLASSLINLAVIHSLQKDPAGAEPLLRRALSIREKELQAGHPSITSSEVRLGEILLDQRKYGEAETILRKAVTEIHAISFPLPIWQVAEAELALGVALAEHGDRTEAAKLLRDPANRLKSYPSSSLRRQILGRVRSVVKPSGLND